MGNLEAQNPMGGQVLRIVIYILSRDIDKQYIVMARTSPPVTNSMNVLTPHTTNTGEVAGGVKNGHSCGMDSDCFIEWGKVRNVLCA